ncbi:MAG: hypothetical protein GXP63_05010 [DPANN group archaeon]|nr:hypothetical protein [DPANN group archaeon]
MTNEANGPLHLLLDLLEKKHHISYSELITLLQKRQEEQLKGRVPARLFADRKLGVLEILVRYLKDHRQMSFKEIGKIIQRDNRTIWASYHNACQKRQKMQLPKKPQIYIPLVSFADRRLGPAENVIYHLHAKEQIPFSRIAELLRRDPRTVWTAFAHAKKKMNSREDADAA